jgi:hypothetical protein
MESEREGKKGVALEEEGRGLAWSVAGFYNRALRAK